MHLLGGDFSALVIIEKLYTLRGSILGGGVTVTSMHSKLIPLIIPEPREQLTQQQSSSCQSSLCGSLLFSCGQSSVSPPA